MSNASATSSTAAALSNQSQAPNPPSLAPPNSTTSQPSAAIPGPSSSAQAASQSHATAAAPSAASTVPAPAASAPASGPNAPPAHQPQSHGDKTRRRWLQNPSFANVLGAIALVLTVVGIGWTLGAGAAELDIQKWTARNDALQSCLAWEGFGHSSRYCNDTIKAGVTRPPLLRRAQAHVWAVTQPSSIVDFWLVLTLTTTVAAGILSLIYSRPRIELFRPVISPVRICWQQFEPSKVAQATRHWLSGRPTMHNEFVSTGSDIDGSKDPVFGTPDEVCAEVGIRIGNFYDSDGEADGEESGMSTQMLERQNSSIQSEDDLVSKYTEKTIREIEKVRRSLLTRIWNQHPSNKLEPRNVIQATVELRDVSDHQLLVLANAAPSGAHESVVEIVSRNGAFESPDSLPLFSEGLPFLWALAQEMSLRIALWDCRRRLHHRIDRHTESSSSLRRLWKYAVQDLEVISTIWDRDRDWLDPANEELAMFGNRDEMVALARAAEYGARMPLQVARSVILCDRILGLPSLSLWTSHNRYDASRDLLLRLVACTCYLTRRVVEYLPYLESIDQQEIMFRRQTRQ